MVLVTRAKFAVFEFVAVMSSVDQFPYENSYLSPFFLISHTNKCYEIKKKLNKYTHITAMKLFKLVSHAAVEMSLNEVVKRK